MSTQFVKNTNTGLTAERRRDLYNQSQGRIYRGEPASLTPEQARIRELISNLTPEQLSRHNELTKMAANLSPAKRQTSAELEGRIKEFLERLEKVSSEQGAQPGE